MSLQHLEKGCIQNEYSSKQHGKPKLQSCIDKNKKKMAWDFEILHFASWIIFNRIHLALSDKEQIWENRKIKVVNLIIGYTLYLVCKSYSVVSLTQNYIRFLGYIVPNWLLLAALCPCFWKKHVLLNVHFRGKYSRLDEWMLSFRMVKLVCNSIT